MLNALKANGFLLLECLKKAWLIILGLLIVYFPTFYKLSNTLWNQDENAHGPIILLVVLFLFWQKRDLFKGESRPAFFSGSIIFIAGLIFYVVGASQDILLLEVGSLPFVLLGLVLGFKGWQITKLFLFPILFTLFMVPLPGFLVDSLTGSLKRHISELSETILYYFGYPVARQGVMIMIGPFKLLVADACSGMHSIFSLSAVGILYIYLMDYKHSSRNWLIAMTIVPIAFFANLCRVIALILITYYLGDEVGQGFLHGFTGIFLFVVALCSLFLVDKILSLIYDRKTSLRKA
ncbi:MAG: exosortase B [Pseudomonadota bacterium]